MDDAKIRRQVLAKSVLSKLDFDGSVRTRDITSDPVGTALHLLELTRAWVPSYLDALSGAGPSDADGTALKSAADTWQDISNTLGSLPDLRPWHGLKGALTSMLLEVRDAMRFWTSAYGSDSPGDAQHQAATAQSSLDRATTKLDGLMEILVVLRNPGEISELASLIARQLSALILSQGKGDILLAENRGKAELSGMGLPASDGDGLAYLLLSTRLNFFGYVPGWRDDLIKFADIVNGRKERLAVLVQDERFTSDLTARAASALADGRLAAILLAASGSDRDTATTALGLALDLLEGLGKVILAALATLLKGKSYGFWVEKDFGMLHNALKATSSIGWFTSQLHVDLRHAKAHADWTVDDGCLVLRPGEPTRRTLNGLQLADALLEIEECVTIAFFILQSVAQVGAKEGTLRKIFDELGFGEDKRIQAAFAICGLNVVAVSDAGLEGPIQLNGRGEIGRMGLGIMFAQEMCDTPKSLAINIEHAGGISTILTPAAAPQRPEMAPGGVLDESALKLLVLARLTTLDGLPALSLEDFRSFLAVLVMKESSRRRDGWLHALVRLRKAADQGGDAILSKSIRVLLRVAASVGLPGANTNEELEDVVNEISGFAAHPAQMPSPWFG